MLRRGGNRAPNLPLLPTLSMLLADSFPHFYVCVGSRCGVHSFDNVLYLDEIHARFIGIQTNKTLIKY